MSLFTIKPVSCLWEQYTGRSACTLSFVLGLFDSRICLVSISKFLPHALEDMLTLETRRQVF